MGFYDVDQDIEVFELYRKGKALILNPHELTVSINDEMHRDDGKGWSKGTYDCYQLADILINGYQYTENTPVKRPFMFYLKEFLDNNQRHHVAPIVQRNMTYDRSERGWWVDWDQMAEELQDLCIKILAQDVAPMLEPITDESQRKKSKAGYGDLTLYATGQLFESVQVY